MKVQSYPQRAHKGLDHAYLGSNHTHFCTIEATVTMQTGVLDEITNSKSSRADLAGTFSYFDSYSCLVELRM